jgi:nitroreductase
MQGDSPNQSHSTSQPKHISYTPPKYTAEQAIQRICDFKDVMSQRRSVRHFSSASVDPMLVKLAIHAACTAPSGANKQPWTFCLIGDKELKRQIREKAEEEEYKSYNGRMSPQWIKDLSPLGTDHRKPFLETAPYLIAVFKQPYDFRDGEKVQNYYVNESVGIAVGILLSALHIAGLSTLTHTPSPMNFLSDLLQRPKNERPYLLIPVGYAHPNATVPDILRKPIDQVLREY